MTFIPSFSAISDEQIAQCLLNSGEDPSVERITLLSALIDPTGLSEGPRADAVQQAVDDVRRVLQASHASFAAPESRTMDSGKILLDDALATVGATRTEWTRHGELVSPWDYTDVSMPGISSVLRVGVSAGGVVSVAGDPFTPDQKRRMNVNLDAVVFSLTENRQVKFDLMQAQAALTSPGAVTPPTETAALAPASAEVGSKSKAKRPKAKFEPTAEIVASIENVLAARVWRDTVTPIVLDYQRRILAEHQWKTHPDRVGKNRPEVISDPKYSWTMPDEDFVVYDQKCREARDKAELPVHDDEYCPMLVAENAVRIAERRMVEAIAPTVGTTADDVYSNMDATTKFIDLTVRFLEQYVDKERTLARAKQLVGRPAEAASTLDM